MIKTPHLSVDGIVELYGEDGTLTGIVLIERKNPPLGWALPGGFVDVGERVETALKREMREEICLEVEITAFQGLYSDPERDPRFHTASAVFVCRANGTPRAADDARAVHLVRKEALGTIPFVFDHRRIVEDYLRGKRAVIA